MNIIFDLDGTLIDSSDGILAAVDLAFESCQVEKKIPLSSELIGPPLGTLLRMLSGSDDEQILASLAQAFKQCYDGEGYKKTMAFEGITEMLNILASKGITLFILTNKRINPTQSIVSYFGWEQVFEAIYALDMYPQFTTKAEVIHYVVQQRNLSLNNTVYVGDTVADFHAARSNGMTYFMVSWGYHYQEVDGATHVNSVQQLTNSLLELNDILKLQTQKDE
jgi:phosphoglycolate phosphatase